MRIVTDTNTLISMSITPSSVSRRAFLLAAQLGKIIASTATIDEFESVLLRDKFERFQPLSERKQTILELRKLVEFVEITETIRECRDPNDDMFLELAVSGKADCIISGDKDLKVLHPFRGISILSSRDFLERFGDE